MINTIVLISCYFFLSLSGMKKMSSRAEELNGMQVYSTQDIKLFVKVQNVYSCINTPLLSQVAIFYNCLHVACVYFGPGRKLSIFPSIFFSEYTQILLSINPRKSILNFEALFFLCCCTLLFLTHVCFNLLNFLQY